MDDELRGVKGWLLAFVIIIAVVSPAWGAITIYRELYTGQAAYLLKSERVKNTYRGVEEDAEVFE